MTPMPDIVRIAIERLRPNPRNARVHSKRQIRQIVASIRRFGFTNPVLIGEDLEIIAGHGRVAAAKELGLTDVPTIHLSHMSSEERRAYVLADNKIALNSGWDPEILAIEFQDLIKFDFDLDLTGFSPAEIDLTLDFASESSARKKDPADLIPEPPKHPVTQPGDLWSIGRHRLLCGDARLSSTVDRLMGADRAALIFTDPPYNVPISDNVSGLGAVRHKDFAMACGEMTRQEFTQFLTTTLGAAAAHCRDGAIAFVCMDWRHMGELLEAGEAIFSELKNVCVWNKSNAGMGTFYRSKHELIFVFKYGSGPHLNNFGLGESGRHRTNVWDYAGISSLSGKRADELAMHPTVKPVTLVADAIKDCSLRADIVLDVFGGSGSTLIAAETCGRLARLIEYDPAYCDTIVRRWEHLTGKQATMASTGKTFEAIDSERGIDFDDRPVEAALRSSLRKKRRVGG
ncbi:MAG: site-specific DNA-methyltransferase [Beijerinckiaceae bacterium]